MKLFDLVQGRVIVFADKDTSTIITWNESLTFQFWRVNGEGFEEYDVVTVSETIFTLQQAQAKARGLFFSRECEV